MSLTWNGDTFICKNCAKEVGTMWRYDDLADCCDLCGLERDALILECIAAHRDSDKNRTTREKIRKLRPTLESILAHEERMRRKGKESHTE